VKLEVRWARARVVLETNCSLKWGITRIQQRNGPLCASDRGGWQWYGGCVGVHKARFARGRASFEANQGLVSSCVTASCPCSLRGYRRSAVHDDVRRAQANRSASSNLALTTPTWGATVLPWLQRSRHMTMPEVMETIRAGVLGGSSAHRDQTRTSAS
jgi:hypothetical protein